MLPAVTDTGSFSCLVSQLEKDAAMKGAEDYKEFESCCISATVNDIGYRATLHTVYTQCTQYLCRCSTNIVYVMKVMIVLRFEKEITSSIEQTSLQVW